MKIEKQHLVTGALLAFVAVTGVTLAVKETRHSRAVAATEAAAPASPTAAPAAAPRSGLAAPPEDPLPAPSAAPVPSEAARPEAAAGPHGVSAGTSRPKALEAPAAARPGTPAPTTKAVISPAPAEPPTTIFVTYFHTTTRCVSCVKIENLTEMTMATRLSGPVAEKRVVFRSVNVDEPVNAHFVKDYGLFTKSVVVSEVKGGFEVRWKNLDQVWHLLGNPESFQSYVEREVQAFLERA
jgi:hypothetical protein